MHYCLFLASKSLKEKDWGYNQHDLAVIRLEKGSDFEKFKNDIQSNPNILEITGSQQQVGRNIQPLKVQIAGEEYNVKGITVAENFLQTLDMPIIEGRGFDARLESEGTQ